ncbi:MAG TPA: peptidoglycan-binding protein [Streptosporangiaceae bacterium]|nr:peptidoglycan-binding protein [Streptosporangiaceae bacterium]
MSSTDAREQADGPAVPEPAAPGGVAELSGPLPPARSGGHALGGPATGTLPGTGHRRRGRGWIAVVVVVVLAGAGLAGADAAGVFRPAKPAGSNNAYATSVATVRRGSLTSQTEESATLGSAGSYSVVVPGSSSGSGGGAPGSGSGSAGSGTQTLTSLPQVGQIIRQGHVIYEINQTPVVLLYGGVPSYRDLSEGMTGGDVRELNADLVKLGYATAAAMGPASGWDYFSSETAYALEQLQSRLGLTETGSLPLGQAVFLPTAIQVTGLGTGVAAGGPASAGSVVLTGSSLTPVVTIDLDASLQTEVAVGDKVSVTLPDGTATPGTISQISTVASASSSSGSSSSQNGNGNGNEGGSGGGSGSATITVLVSLTNPKAAGNLNQAPVQVTLTTGSVSNALIVPVDALLAEPGGKYAVEVTGPSGHHLVAVTPGLFDDAAGTVQVTGNLTPGEHVVVPGI